MLQHKESKVEKMVKCECSSWVKAFSLYDKGVSITSIKEQVNFKGSKSSLGDILAGRQRPQLRKQWERDFWVITRQKEGDSDSLLYKAFIFYDRGMSSSDIKKNLGLVSTAKNLESIMRGSCRPHLRIRWEKEFWSLQRPEKKEVDSDRVLMKAFSLRAQGWYLDDIIKKLKLISSWDRLHGIFAGRYLPHLKTTWEEAHGCLPRHKVPEATVDQLFQMKSNGMRNCDIARTLQVSPAFVTLAIAGKRGVKRLGKPRHPLFVET